MNRLVDGWRHHLDHKLPYTALSILFMDLKEGKEDIKYEEILRLFEWELRDPFIKRKLIEAICQRAANRRS